MLLPAALIVFGLGCSSIPTVNIHPAKPVGKNQFGLQSDYLFAYDAVSMVAGSDFDDFEDIRMPCITIAGRYGITTNTEFNLMVYGLPVSFETYAKSCIANDDRQWFSLELGSGCNLQTKGSNNRVIFAPIHLWLGDDIDYESIDYYYNNYYFFTGMLYEYHISRDFGFNTRLSGYCANVNIKTVTDTQTVNHFDRLFFPQLGLSILSPGGGDGNRIALNFDVIYFKNPIDDEWYPGYNFGISLLGNLFSKKNGDHNE